MSPADIQVLTTAGLWLLTLVVMFIGALRAGETTGWHRAHRELRNAAPSLSDLDLLSGAFECGAARWLPPKWTRTATLTRTGTRERSGETGILLIFGQAHDVPFTPCGWPVLTAAQRMQLQEGVWEAWAHEQRMRKMTAAIPEKSE